MPILAKNVPLTLFGKTYLVNLFILAYATTQRPAITAHLASDEHFPRGDLPAGELLCKATTNVPEEYIQHLPPVYFAAKTYSENEELWPQLLALTDEEGYPLFLDNRPTKVTCGHTTIPIYSLGRKASQLFLKYLAESRQP